MSDGDDLIYIGAYGRSGSTLLENWLSSEPGVFSGGEMIWLLSEDPRYDVCSCGQALSTCPFWAEVLRDVSIADRQAAHQTDVLNTQTYRVKAMPIDEYTDLWAALFDNIRHQSGAEVIVDASKTALRCRRAQNLLQGFPHLMFVHLYRDLIQVLASRRRGDNRILRNSQDASPSALAAFTRGARATFGWTAANMIAGQVRRKSSESVEISHEMFCQFPAKTTEMILGDIDARAPQVTSHAIAGNRNRVKEIRLEQTESSTRGPVLKLASAYQNAVLRTSGIRQL